MDAAADLRPGWRGWLDAWRQLKHNPVAVHLRRAEQRRRRRIGWVRRNLLVLIGLASGIVVYSYYLSTASMPSMGSADQWAEFIVIMIGILIGPPLLLWLAQGVYVAVYDAMGLLGVQGQRQCYLNIDDLASIGLLDDREIVVGAVRVLLPPLLWRVMVCAAALIPAKVWMVVSFSALRSLAGSTVPSGSASAAIGALTSIGDVPLRESLIRFWQLAPSWLRGLLIGLADTPVVLLTGLLACTILILLMIGFGRGVRIGAAGATAGVLTSLAQLGFVYAGMFMHQMALILISGRNIAYTSQSQPTGPPYIAPALLAALLLAAMSFAALIALASTLARLAPAVRATLASALPLIGMVGGIAAVSLPSTLAFGNLGSAPAALNDLLLVTISQYDVGWAAVAVCNPAVAAVPQDLYLQVVADHATWWPEWLRMPVLVLLQLVLIALLARFAREAVHDRRRESHG